jgi:hypothetical protein
LPSLLALALYLTVALASSSSALHHFFHEDADAREHHCIVTMISSGQLEAPVTAVTAEVPGLIVRASDRAEQPLLPPLDLRLPPGRAPPVLFAQLSHG